MKIRWLGQAGFLITLKSGKRIAIDPYLGDSCMELVGYRRMTPAPIALKDLDIDYLFISHEHPDHLDIDLYDALKEKPYTQIFGNVHCKELLSVKGMDDGRLKVVEIGQKLKLDDFSVTIMKS